MTVKGNKGKPKKDYIKRLIRDIGSIEKKTSKKIVEVTLNGKGKITYLGFFIKS